MSGKSPLAITGTWSQNVLWSRLRLTSKNYCINDHTGPVSLEIGREGECCAHNTSSGISHEH